MNTEDMLALTCGQDHNNKISTDMLQGSQVTIITIYITIANEHKYSIFFTKHNIFTIFLNVSFEWVKNRKVVEDILNWVRDANLSLGMQISCKYQMKSNEIKSNIMQISCSGCKNCECCPVSQLIVR